MTTLPFNFTTFAAATLGFHLKEAMNNPTFFVETLDENADGDLSLLAQYMIDLASDSDDYDPLINLFFDTEDEVTDDDMELIGRWLSDEIHDMLTDAYKKIESQLRLVYNNDHPTIDDI
jgi:hypothetical protein